MSKQDIDYTKPYPCDGEECDFRALTLQGRRNHYRACKAHEAYVIAFNRRMSEEWANEVRARVDAQIAAEDALAAAEAAAATTAHTPGDQVAMTDPENCSATWHQSHQTGTVTAADGAAWTRVSYPDGSHCEGPAAAFTTVATRAAINAAALAQLDAEDAAAEAKAENDGRNRCGYCRRIYANGRNLATHQTRCATRKTEIAAARALETSIAATATEGTDMSENERDESPEAVEARKIAGNTAKLSNAIGGRIFGR